MHDTDTRALRPIERRVLRMHRDGIAIDDIASRFNKTPEFVERLIVWTGIPRTGEAAHRTLRPLERRVLTMRAEGETHQAIAARFRKTERFIRQVEGLAHFKEGQRLLSGG